MELLHGITHASWFVAVDLAFHIIVIGHVVHHMCRAGKRLHQWVHEPVARWMGRRPTITDRTTALAAHPSHVKVVYPFPDYSHTEVQD